MTVDRREILDRIVQTRAMVLATLPAEEDEPPWRSTVWSVGIARTLGRCMTLAVRGDAEGLRDQLYTVGAHLLGWLERVEEELDP